MNQRAAFFEIGSITVLLLIGASLSSVSIENTGILSVAALLTLFCATSHYKAVLGLATQLSQKQSWFTASTSNSTES